MPLDLSFGGTAFPRATEVRQKLYESGNSGVSARFRTLDRLDAFYQCCEYDHQETNWNGYPANKFESISPDAILPFGFVQPTELPVRQRRPTAPLRLTPLVVDRFTSFIFGEGRTPKVRVEDDPIADDFLQAVFRHSLFWREMKIARTLGGSMGSTLITAHLKPDFHTGLGRFVFKAHSPKSIHDIVWADPDAKIPAGVLIQYVYFEEREGFDSRTGEPTGRKQQVPLLYRRIIDEEMDIVFIPAPISNNEMPDLALDESLSHIHKLGRFPGVWVQNLPVPDELDGLSDCDGAYQMFEAIDRQIAQTDKALLANQDPTLVLSRDTKLDKIGVPLKKGSENALNVGMGGSASYLEMSGSAQTTASAFIKDLRQAALDKCQVILADPQTLSASAQSALAIELLYQPMLAKAGSLREQYGQAIEQLARITLDLARVWINPIQYSGRSVPQFDLPPRIEKTTLDPTDPISEVKQTFESRSPGIGSFVSLAWGAFFASTHADDESAIRVIVSAVAANLLDLETAIQKAAIIFKIDDVDGLRRKVMLQIEKQKEERNSRFVLDDVYTGGMLASEMSTQVDDDSVEIIDEDSEKKSHEDDVTTPLTSKSTALNGAQVLSAKQIVLDVSAGLIPRESGVNMLIAFFSIPPNAAEQIMGDVGRSFVPTSPPSSEL